MSKYTLKVFDYIPISTQVHKAPPQSLLFNLAEGTAT